MKKKAKFFRKRGEPLLFNTYDNGVIGVSVRLLDSSYSGNCLQVRRDNDNATQDIGFVNGYLDTSTLLTFVGSNSGYISKWYNQGSVGGSFDQSTTTAQPRIVNAGTLVTDNGLAAIDFIDSTRYLDSTFLDGGFSASYSFYCVGQSINNTTMMKSPTASGYYIFANAFNQFLRFRNGGTERAITFVFTKSVQTLWSAFDVSDVVEAFVNNSSKGSGALNGNWSSTIGLRIQQYAPVQETIIFSDDKTSDNTGIVTDINGYYSIY